MLGVLLCGRRARRQGLDLVEELSDRGRLRLEVGRIAAAVAPTAPASAAARDEDSGDENARENCPKTSSTRQQVARTVAPCADKSSAIERRGL